MPLNQTYTSLGSLSSVTSGSWVAVPADSPELIVTVNATSVTSGAVIAIEGRNVGPTGGTTATRELLRATIAADGVKAYPISRIKETHALPDQVRLTVVSRTDGTYAGQIVTDDGA